ncbi:MAG: type II secretion system protein [Clostridiales bacterium]|nr:type II secretion system protein [Clostridiales bacterium]
MKRGFTLFELIVILALLAIVTLTGFTILMTSSNMYSRSQENSDLYYQVRLASDVVRNEIRNATEIEIGPNVDDLGAIKPNNFIAGYEYLYIENNILIHYSGSEKEKTKAMITELSPMFILNLVDSTKNNTITYTIEGTISNSKGNRTYDVKTTIHLNNIRNMDGTSGQWIKYKKP